MTFSDPLKNVKQFQVGEGMTVVDFGAGSGFYTFAAAQLVGESGKVYAVDIQQDLLQRVKNHAEKEGLENVEIVVGDLEKENGSKLGDAVADALIVSNVFFQVEDKKTFIIEAKRVLRNKGRLLFVDWSDSFGGVGPQPEDVVTKKDALHYFENAGFELEREIQTGEHHYGLIFKKT